MSTELAWAAGFFDGEGHSRQDALGYLRLDVGQTDVEPLERMQAATGCGIILGPYARRNPEHKPIWRWSATSHEAERAMQLMWPYLSSPKRDQFIAAKSTARVARRKGFCKNDLHDLTAEGTRYRDGRCKACRLASNKNGRVAP